MAKDNVIEMEGTIIEKLPNAMFQVELVYKRQALRRQAGNSRKEVN